MQFNGPTSLSIRLVLVIRALALLALGLLAGNVHRDALAPDDFLQVLGLELAVLVVAVWFLDGDARHVEDAPGLLEDVVHFFQRAVPRFREEEVDHGEHEGVAALVSCVAWEPMRGVLHDGEDDVGFVSDVLECNGRDHHHHEVEDPVGTACVSVMARGECGAAYLVERALVGARIRSGTISAGYSQVIPSQPMAKNVLKTKRKTACPIPA